MQPLLMLDIGGTRLTAEDRELLRHPCTGGLILFTRNFESRAQVSDLIAEIRAVRPRLLVAVDQEGGRVQRFREGFVRLPPMQALGRRYDQDAGAALDEARLLGRLMAAELVACGVDISFAPVLDLDYGQSSVIGDRSFHREAARVVQLAGSFIDGMGLAGMAATGKHFPGHGHVQADSHLELPIDERPFAEIERADLVPFAALATQLAGIMPAHVVYREVDTQPAGFSRFWLQDILRNRLQFKGLIFSDDLAMAGAAIAGDFAARAQAALGAGCDMVLVCNDRPGAVAVLDFLEKYVPERDLVLADSLLASPRPCPETELAQARDLAARLRETA